MEIIVKKVWIALSVIILSFPIGYIGIIFYKYTKKVIKKIRQSIINAKALEKIKEDLIEKKTPETKIEKEIKENQSRETSIEIQKTIIQDITQPEIKENIEITSENIQPRKTNEKQKKELDKILYEANFLKKEGRLQEYEQKLIEGLSINSDNIEIIKLLGDLYFTIGDNKKALTLLKKIIEKEPENDNAIRQLGEIYLNTGDFETAEILIEKAIDIQPRNPKHHITMVEILYNTDRVREAIAVMEKVIKLRPSNTNYILTLAELYEEVKDLESAQKYYFKILEIEPSHEKAKKKIQS